MSRLLEIGERLAVAREKAGYSQEAFAEKMGCSTITVSRWENGHTSMKAPDLICAAQALGVSVDYLLGVSKPGGQLNDMIADLNIEQRKFVMSVVSVIVASA